MQRTLWVISELYYPETSATGYILTQIAEGLSRSFNVNVICAQPTYSARGTRAPSNGCHNGINIKRCWGTTLNKDILPLRLINLVTITLSIFFIALFSFRPGNLVLVVTNPPNLPFVIAIASKLRKAKCSMIVHDVYPDVAIAVGKLSAKSFFARFLAQLNKHLYRSMQRVFVLGRDMQERVARELNTHKEHVVVATNWADLDIVNPQFRQENALLRELELDDKFVIQYAGNMGYPNDIETIVQAAIMLKAQGDIHFVFLGSGIKKSQIESARSDNALTNITVLGQKPRSEQSNFLNACDIAVIALVSGMKGVSVPSRTYNTLAAGKPIIAIVEQGSELGLIIEEDDVGWIVKPGCPEQLVSIILEAKSQSALRAQMAQKARSVAESKYAFASVLQIFHTHLSSIA